MSDFNEELLIARRNITAIGEHMKHFEARRAEDATRVMQLQETVTMLTQQVQALQIQVAVMRANAQGHGVS